MWTRYDLSNACVPVKSGSFISSHRNLSKLGSGNSVSTAMRICILCPCLLFEEFLGAFSPEIQALVPALTVLCSSQRTSPIGLPAKRPAAHDYGTWLESCAMTGNAAVAVHRCHHRATLLQTYHPVTRRSSCLIKVILGLPLATLY